MGPGRVHGGDRAVPGSRSERFRIVVDADACVPAEVRARLRLAVTPAEPELLLERGWGRPPQSIELTGKDGKDLISYREMTTAEREVASTCASASMAATAAAPSNAS